MECYLQSIEKIIPYSKHKLYGIAIFVIIESTAKLYRTFMSAPTRLLQYFLPVLHDGGSGDIEGDSDTDSS